MCYYTFFATIYLSADSPGVFGSPRYGIHLSRTGCNHYLQVVATNEEHKPLLGKYLLWCDNMEGLVVEESDWFAKRDLDGVLFGDHSQRIKTKLMYLLARKWGMCLPPANKDEARSTANHNNNMVNSQCSQAAPVTITTTTTSTTTSTSTDTTTMNTTSINSTTTSNNTTRNPTTIPTASTAAGSVSFTASSDSERTGNNLSETVDRTKVAADLRDQTAAVDKDDTIRRQEEEIRRYDTVTQQTATT